MRGVDGFPRSVRAVGVSGGRPARRAALRTVVAALALVAADEALPPRNAKVVEFARAQVGKRVGDGECTSLAVAALRAAGARGRPFDRGDGDYVWGRPVDSFREALPGDVVQFRDAVFQGKRSVGNRRISWRYGYPHHTAVVAAVKERGASVTFLHQNVGSSDTPEAARRVVSETTVRTASLQKGGKVWIYRPVGPDEPVGEPEQEPGSGPTAP